MRGSVLTSMAAVALVAAAASACQHDSSCDPERVPSGGATLTPPTVSLTGCLVSEFPVEDVLGREVSGRARYGTEFVPQVMVHLDATASYGRPDAATEGNVYGPGFGLDTVITDSQGFFRFSTAPLFYELSLAVGTDFFKIGELPVRYFEPSLGPDGAPQVWSSHLELTLVPPPGPGEQVAFFVTGTDAYDVNGGVDDLVVRTRQFSQTVTLLVVVYPSAGSLLQPSAFGCADAVAVSAAMARRVVLATVPVSAPTVHESVKAFVPAGLVPGPVQISLDFGTRTSTAKAGTTTVGADVLFPSLPIPQMSCPSVVAPSWYMRLVASGPDGATSDSGRAPIVFNTLPVLLTLATPPSLGAPAAGVAAGGHVGAMAKGAREHLLTPDPSLTNAPTIHVITTDADVAIPDPTTLGLGAPAGRYTWLVRSWPDTLKTADVGGPDLRDTARVTVSAPRSILLP